MLSLFEPALLSLGSEFRVPLIANSPDVDPEVALWLIRDPEKHKEVTMYYRDYYVSVIEVVNTEGEITWHGEQRIRASLRAQGKLELRYGGYCFARFQMTTPETVVNDLLKPSASITYDPRILKYTDAQLLGRDENPNTQDILR